MVEREKSAHVNVAQLWNRHTVRLRIAFLVAWALVSLGLMRVSLSMAMVCMVNRTTHEAIVPGDSYALNATEIPNETTERNKTCDSESKINWSVPEQGRIHTGYYVGAIVAVFSADRMIMFFGAKRLIQFSVAVNILGTIFTPSIARHFASYIFLMCLRSAMGFGQGFLIPSASVLIAKWFTVTEKSTAMAIFSSGNQVSITLAMFLTAKLCQIDFLGGWPFAFYLYALFALIFIGFWTVYAADRPKLSKFISITELQHITGEVVKTRAMSIQLATPYRKILTSPTILAICLNAFCQSFLMVTLVTFLPQYYHSALGMDLNSNGIMSALPFLIQLFGKIGCATIADSVKKRERWSIDCVTKAANSIASLGCAVCVLGMAFLGANHSALAVLLLSLGMALQCGYVAGYNTSIVCVAPNFTAAVASYSQIFAQAGSALAPMVIGMMTTEGTIGEWRLVFFLLAGILCITGAIFQIFGTASVEPWADTHPPIIQVSMHEPQAGGLLLRQMSALSSAVGSSNIAAGGLGSGLRVPRKKTVSIRVDSDFDDDFDDRMSLREPLSMTDLSRL